MLAQPGLGHARRFATGLCSDRASLVSHPRQDQRIDLLAKDKVEGLDVVLDAVGGESWGRSYDLLGPTGQLVAFALAGRT